jgi:hypothetical protein
VPSGLVLGDRGQDVHGEPVRHRHVSRDEVDAGTPQRRDERDIASQRVQLRDHQDRARGPARRTAICGLSLRLPLSDLLVFVDKGAAGRDYVTSDGFPLGFKPRATGAFWAVLTR